jgi:putative spermidine/putrescine transport system ATP-binding protein
MNMMTSPQATQPRQASTPAIGAALELRGLRCVYAGGVIAVDDVNLDIAPGEFVTLLGPSGSGKTTTLKMVAGFEYPDEGEIVLGGRSITTMQAHERDIGMVFQNYALFPHMTVAENIAFPLRMRRRPKQEIARLVSDVLALVKLADFGKRYPKQLSGGQQQRVALARAIVFSPPLLLMDEPLGALDRQLRKSVQQELKRISKSLGITVVFVTHDQDEALYLSDRIAVMNEGRIVQVGAPEDLYAQPSNRFVAEFLGESNFLSGTVETVDEQRVAVRLPGGELVAGVPAAKLAVGARADVMVRPESLSVARADLSPAPHANVLDGVVRMVNFIGNAREYEIHAANVDLTAHRQIKSGRESFAVGDPVRLTAAEKDCLVFESRS